MNKDWSEAKRLESSPVFTERDFRETLDGGQSFRWTLREGGTYEGVFGRTAARLSLDNDGKLIGAFPKCADRAESEKALLEYLDAGRDYSAIVENTDDPRVKTAAKKYSTLRILRQSPQEAIICFICSSSKRIVQIKQCVRHLADKLGEPVACGHNALPSFETLADAPDEILKDCKLGYRAAYLKKTAQKIIADKFAPESLRNMDYPEAKKYLLTLHGVGEKVADCILLFGAAKFEAFPVDTWISKTMADLYGLQNPKHVRTFAAEKFGKNAGFIQQLLFAAIREGVKLQNSEE